MTEAEARRRRGLRQLLQDDLRLPAQVTSLPTGERKLVFRLDAQGRIR